MCRPAAPLTAVGELVTMRPGDMLVLPAGLYHDVQCAGDDAALSLTIRFEVTMYVRKDDVDMTMCCTRMAALSLTIRFEVRGAEMNDDHTCVCRIRVASPSSHPNDARVITATRAIVTATRAIRNA